MKNTTLLRKIGLNDTAIAIYLYLLEQKKATILDVSRATKVARTSVYNNIELLKEWNLVGEAIEGTKKYLYAESPSNLVNAVRMKEKIAQQAAELLLPTFEKDRYESKIQFGYGEEGFRKFAYDMLESGEKDVRQIINSKSLFTYSNNKFLQKHWDERKKRGIAVKILMKSSDKKFISADTNTIKNIEYLRQIKFLPTQITIDTSFIIYGDYITFFAPPEEGYVFRFQSNSFVSTIKSIFDYLWDVSEEFE
ncbi:MAG: TrmB family transcriptional regulator [Patescibacteria group bacterium]